MLVLEKSLPPPSATPLPASITPQSAQTERKALIPDQAGVGEGEKGENGD